MAQRRLFDFYADLTDNDFYTLHGALHKPGKLFGFEPSVSGTSIVLTAGGVITPEGIVIVDDETQTLPVSATPVPGPTARKYTIVLQHINTEIVGGSAATWVAIDDPTYFYTQSPGAHQVASDQTVVFWLNYPGGNVPLADNMIIPAAPIRDEQPYVHQNALQPTTIASDWLNQLDVGVSQETAQYNGLVSSYVYTPVLTPGPYPKTSYVTLPMFNGYSSKGRAPYAFRMYGLVQVNTRVRLTVLKNFITYTSPWVSGPQTTDFEFDMLSATPNPITDDNWASGPYSATVECEHNAAGQDIYISALQPLSIG